MELRRLRSDTEGSSGGAKAGFHGHGLFLLVSGGRGGRDHVDGAELRVQDARATTGLGGEGQVVLLAGRGGGLQLGIISGAESGLMFLLNTRRTALQNFGRPKYLDVVPMILLL